MPREADTAHLGTSLSALHSTPSSLTDELANQLETYRGLIDCARAIVWRADAQTFQFTFISGYAETLLGYPLQLWISEPTFWTDHIHPDDRDWAIAFCSDATKENRTHELEYRMMAADGRAIWLLDIVRVVTENDQPKELVGVMVDITEKKNAEQELERSEDRLRQAIDAIPEQIWSGPPDGSLDFCNARWRTELGLTLEQIQGDGWQQMLHPDDRDRVLKAWRESVANGTRYEQEERHRLAGGQYRWYLCRGVPLRDEPGNVVRWFGSNTDIDSQKQAEAALRKSEQRWRAVFDNACVGVSLMDSSLRYVEANAAYERMLGYSLDELRSKTCLDVTFEEDRPMYQTFVNDLLEGKRDRFDLEKRYRRKDGEVIWARINGSRIYSGESRLWVVMAEDITDRKRLGDQLKQERDRLRLLLDLNHQFISKLDLRAFLDAVLDGLSQLAGWKSATVFLPEPARSRLTVYLNRGTILFPEGTTVPIDGTLSGQVYRSGQPVTFTTSDLPTVCSEYFNTPWMKKEIQAKNLQGGCVLPVLHAGQTLGVLFLMTAEQDPSIYDLKFLQELATLVGAALNNALLFDRVNASHAKLLSERKYIEDDVRREGGFDEIIGESSALMDVLQQVNTVAPTDSTVLLMGDTGTGKELLARAIHDRSARREHGFIKIDCAAIPSALMESELFGHEKGAFTGAVAQKLGRFETADQGTLFLDEVGEIPPELQAKLLRVLQYHAFERVGSNRTRQVDVRIVAATNRNLEEMVGKGTFRKDLYYRLKVFPIVIPPLCERPVDIPPLVRYFVSKYARRMKKDVPVIPPAAMEVFMRYPWPGNVRELQHFMERSVIISSGRILRAPLAELERIIDKHPPAGWLQGPAETERESILRVLRESNWVVGGPHGAAVKLGLKRTTLASRMESLGISRPRQSDS